MKKDIPQIEIRHKGIYDLDTIYKSIRGWLRSKEYYYQEPVYKDKTAGDTNEVEIKMEAFLPVTEFVAYTIKLESKFYGYKEFETEFKGEKRKVSKGQFWITLEGAVVYDYQNKFKKKFEEKLIKLLVDRLLKNYYDIKYLDKLYYEVYDLHNLIKKEAGMESATNAY